MSGITAVVTGVCPFPRRSNRFIKPTNNTMIKKTIITLAVISLTSLSAFADGHIDVEVTADITTDTTWSADNDYLLGKPIFVKNGATLTIEPGTMIYGYEDLANGTFGSLVVTRGSKINANGRADAPIVFTALAERDGIDDGAGGTRELTLEDSGLWGGVIILGRAILNTPDNPIVNPTAPVIGTFDVEGFPAGSSDDITYGGDNDEDNSGVLRYVSIRFGGYEFAQDEEINGLTLGAVGSGTTIEYIEVFNNQDDGVEFFGGTVNTRNMVMAFNEDESFDWDQGFRGSGQYWFAIQKSVGEGSNYSLEMDGGDGDVKTLEPFAIPQIYNLTVIGSGEGNPQTNAALRMKDNTGGFFHNSIFTGLSDYAIRIDDADTEAQQANGNLGTFGVIWGTFGTGDGTAASLTRSEKAAELAVVNGIENSNTIADPMLGGISRVADGGLDPIPAAGSPAYAAPISQPVNSFIEAAAYKGAFSNQIGNWAAGWTYLSQKGYFSNAAANINTSNLGWITAPSGYYGAGQWVWSWTLASYVYIGADGPGGSWIYVTK